MIIKNRFFVLAALLLFIAFSNNLLADEGAADGEDRESISTTVKKVDKLEKQIRVFEEKIKKEKQKDEQVQAKLLRKQEEAALRQAKIKAGQEESARKKEERQQALARAKEQRQAQLNARKEEAAHKKEERQQEIARVQEKKQAKIRARQEEKLKSRAECTSRQEQLKARKEEESAEKRLKLEEERKAREGSAEKKEEKLAAEAAKRQEKLEELAQERERKDEEFRIRQEEFVQRQQQRLYEVAWNREQKQAELLARQQELAQLQIERQIEEADLEAQREEQKQRQRMLTQEQMDNQKQQMQAKIEEEKKARAQEKAVAELKLKEEQEEQASTEEIETLWRCAKQYYNQKEYEQAIQALQKIIALGESFRSKYIPKAREFITKAEIKIKQKNEIIFRQDNEPLKQEAELIVIDSKSSPSFPPPVAKKSVFSARRAAHSAKEPDSLVEPPEIIKNLRGARITMDFDKTALKSVLTFLTQESGVNFVASQKILEREPEVSVRLKDATADEAIKCIAKNLGLVYRINKEAVWVASPAEVAGEPIETRFYYLNKKGALATKSGPVFLAATEKSGELSSEQIFVIEDALKELIPQPAESKIYYDTRINALFVRNTPANLQQLEEVLYNTR